MASRINYAQDLVYTTNYIEGKLPLQEVKVWFQTQTSISCLGVVLDKGSFGIISRIYLNQLLVNRGLDQGILETPIEELMTEEPLIVDANHPIEDVVTALITQKAESDDFLNDIVVKEDVKYVGLISVKDLMIEFTENIIHRLTAMEAQQASLIKRNKDLFQGSFNRYLVDVQFRTIFEHIPLPICTFDKTGNLVNANERLAKLHTSSQAFLKKRFNFEQLFDADFEAIYTELQKTVHKKDDSEPIIYDISFMPQNGSNLEVEACLEFSNEANLIVLTIIRIKDQSNNSNPIKTIIDSTNPSEEEVGAMTQAINTELDNLHAKGLARNVAQNLIDKEDKVDAMMKKLEKIISVAEKVEDATARIQPAQSDQNAHLLHGDLSEFSIIDLCQIIVQGSKTGHLTITDNQQANYHIYFQGGSIVHSETPEQIDGLEALTHALAVREGSFDFDFDRKAPQNTISGDAMGNLMNACQLMDESH